MKKLIWIIPFMFVGIALAYQVYNYNQTTTVSEPIFVDDSGKINLPENVWPGDEYCGEWSVRNSSTQTKQITITTEISEGLTGVFSVDVTPISEELTYDLTPNITYPIRGCVTVNDDASGEQEISLTISR